MYLVDSTILLLAVWLMGTVDLDIPRTTKQQQKYHEDPDKVYKAFSPGKLYEYTNHDVVPYNKYLLYKYDCHFNIEYCHSVHAIEYSLKYLYKGTDQVTVTIEDNTAAQCIAEQEAVSINEVREFQNKHYVSGAEAAWHQCQNEVADRKPAVNRLQLHLPGEQTVYFDSIKKDESIE